MWRKRNWKIIIHYLSQKKHSLLTLSINGKAILTFRMIIWENLPHSVVLESYFKAFQYKVLNNILYTNKKLFKIGYRTDNVCTFCEAEPKTLYHILYQCPYSRRFWNDFESYWWLLSNQQVHLSLQNVIFSVISKQCPSTKLVNYFIAVKLFLWDCRRNQIHPKIKGYQNKIG